MNTTTLIPKIPCDEDRHDKTGVDISMQRVVPGDPPITLCPLCYVSIPIVSFVHHLDNHANRGERLR